MVITSVWGIEDGTEMLVDAGVSEKSCGAKVAVTEAAAFSVTSQVVVPEHPPLHPVKLEESFGAAVRVTSVPVMNELEHAVPQLIPLGLLITLPPPLPARVTERTETGAAANVAVTDSFVVNVRVHVAAVPEHAPPHPLNSDRRFGEADSVTFVPGANACEQVAGQYKVGGAATVPMPLPATVKERVTLGAVFKKTLTLLEEELERAKSSSLSCLKSPTASQ